MVAVCDGFLREYLEKAMRRGRHSAGMNMEPETTKKHTLWMWMGYWKTTTIM